jgi:predicted nuclease of predicted toxin-antitoxin system
VRLLLDANLSPRRVGPELRRHGHDVRAVAEDAELEGLDDEQVLELATADGRILVTRNSRDFAPICRRWAEAGRDHVGVVLIWTLSHREFAALVRGIEQRLDEIPTQAAWRGIVVAI